MVDLEDGPLGLVARPGRGVGLRVLHLVAEYQKRVFDIGEAGWGRLALRSVPNSWHFHDREIDVQGPDGGL